MTGQSKRVVVVGSLNVDLTFRVPRAPDAGETVPGHSFATSGGGKGANQAVACARLGNSVSMLGRVGNDGFGADLLKNLQNDGIDISRIGRDEYLPSGVAMVLVDDRGQNRIVVVPGANGVFTADLLDPAAFAGAELAVFQLEIPMETVLQGMRAARAAGCKVLLNPAPARQLPPEIWKLIDYLIPNETEASVLTGIHVDGLDGAIKAANALLDRGVGAVLLTLGSKGVLLAGPYDYTHLSAASVKAVDTTAAGDTFIGGFAAGLMQGLSLEDAANLGQKAAAICVTRAGAQTSIPYRHEIA